MVASVVRMFSVNDSSLKGDILILHPIMYLYLCGKFQMGWYCDVEMNEAH